MMRYKRKYNPVKVPGFIQRDINCPNVSCRFEIPFDEANVWGFVECPNCDISLMLNDIYYPTHWLILKNRNPEELDEDFNSERCTWIDLKKSGGGLGYIRCPDLIMTNGLCLYHYKLWKTYERAAAEEQTGNINVFGEDEETRV